MGDPSSPYSVIHASPLTIAWGDLIIRLRGIIDVICRFPPCAVLICSLGVVINFVRRC